MRRVRSAGRVRPRGPGEGARLRARGFRRKRRFGQHFLFNPRLLDFLVEQAQVRAGTRVLEVGPGSGALTRRLLARGARVTAVEIDRDLWPVLREEFGAGGAFELLEGDVLAGAHRLSPVVARWLEADPGPFALVANLPFGCSVPFLLLMLRDARPALETAVVTVQWEVAERFCAAPGSNAYGAVSVLVQTLADVSTVRRIRRQAFTPPPKVDAAVLRLFPRVGEGAPSPALYAVLTRVVKRAFSAPRKKLKGRIESGWPGVSVHGLTTDDARPADLPPSAYLALAVRAAGVEPSG